MTSNEGKQPGLPTIDVQEHGGKREGTRQSMDRRLFMQLLVFDVPPSVSGSAHDADQVAREAALQLGHARIPAVLYADTMSPRGLGLLTWSEDPAHFVQAVRPLFNRGPLSAVISRDSFGMLGRTYATGHEPDLEHALLHRAVENVRNEAFPWHVWYPLRRKAEFARLDGHDQGQILREHATIGMAYGAQELAHDIRLSSYGLDAADNEFVIGLVGRHLQPLSHLIQTMRKTRQTSEFIEKMGPFFVGYVLQRIRP